MLQDYTKRILVGIFIIFVLVAGFLFYIEFFNNPFASASNSNKKNALAKNQNQKQNMTSNQTGTSAQTGATDKITEFEEGKHYKKLPAKITSHKEIQQFIAEDPGKVQVIEFFSYACYWCQRLHPIIDEWIKNKPKNAVVYHVPVIFHPGWDKLAKAYYMVQELGKTQELDQAFFDAIHQNRVNLADEKLLKEFFIKHGIPEAKFNELYNSFSVARSVSKSNELSNAYQIVASPVIILNTKAGSYFISAAMVGSEQGAIDVLNYLIKRDS